MSLCRQRGFSLIELLIVMIIIGIIASIAIPSLLGGRRTSNAASAVEATYLFHSSEITYQSGIGYYAVASELFKTGLIDGELAAAAGVKPGTVSDNGVHVVPANVSGKDGYHFSIEVSPDGRAFTAIATPAGVGRTGDRSFYIDETGVIKVVCTPPQQLNPVTGLCEPGDREITDGHVIESLLSLDRIANGVALRLLIDVPPSPSMTSAVLTMLDADHDGLLAADEILDADVLGMARALRGSGPAVPDIPLHDGLRLSRDIVGTYRTAIARELAIGLGNERVAPVPLPSASGDAMRLIELASRYRTAVIGTTRGR